MHNKIFEEIGFTKGETKVYFALLELGESSVGQISKKSGVTASKTYPVLDRLSQKGLITHTIKSGTKYFQIFSPNKILDYIERKRKKLKTEEEKIKTILPNLISKQKSNAKDSAIIYEGYNGLRTLFEELTDHLKKNKEDFIAFTIGKEYENENLSRFLQRYDLIRKSLGIKTKLIGVEWQKKYFDKNEMKKKDMEVKYLPYTSVPKGVIIVGDKVITMLWENDVKAFVIQSEQIAEAYREFFWDLWKKAER